MVTGLLKDESLGTITGNQITGLEQYYRFSVLKVDEWNKEN